MIGPAENPCSRKDKRKRMRGHVDLPRFWNNDAPKWNFGDAIAYFLRRKLFLDIAPFSSDPWTVGSVLFDGAPLHSPSRDNPNLPSFLDDRNCRAVFWGCGLRDPESLSREFAEHCAIVAVRGPLTASELRLGAAVPVGDPGLLLAALHEPARRARFSGKSVCVPHYQDARSDRQILEASGCDLVLRPAIDPGLEGVERFIDAIASAEFVLCGALHAAVTAAAYGVAFGYWETADIDIPFKWADFSALVAIPCSFSPDLAAAKRQYETQVRPNITIPSMWGLIASAPLPIRPSALLKILRWEAARNGEASFSIDQAFDQFDRLDRSSDRLVDLYREVVNQRIPTLIRDRDQSRQQFVEKSDELAQTRSELAISVGIAQEKDSELIRALARAEASEQNAANLLDAHAQETGSLRSELVLLSSENEALRQQLQASHNALVEHQAALDAKSAQLEQMLSRHEALLLQKDAQIEAAMDALGEKHDELAAQATTLNRLEAEQNARHLEMEAIRAEFAAVEAHAANLDRARAAAEQQLLAASESVELARSDLEHARAERDAAVNQAGRLIGRVRKNKWVHGLTRLPGIAKYDRRFRARVELVESFLAQFSDQQLGMSAEGRGDRVTAYMLGLTSRIEDFPLLDRDIYRMLHPDVAEAGVDPFVHYVQDGYKEGRTPHPLLDHGYYTKVYPETARYAQSILEHYMRFGAAKGYNPCDLFSTKGYFELYPDVKASGCNPLLHYIRHPDCRPHPDFDSRFYRLSNPDVTRAGINPLAHFLLHGREEGRRPTPRHTGIARAAGDPSAARPIPVDQRRSESAGSSARPLVLMMDAFYPRPDHDSGSLDQVNFARIFQSLGYDVAFTALMNFAPEPDAVAALRERGVHCVTAADYINVEEFVVLNRDRISTFFLSRFNFGGDWIDRARSFCPRARIVLNTVDLHFLREERHARLTEDASALASAEKTKGAELAAIAAADVTIVVSSTEREILDELVPEADVRVVPLIREISERPLPPFEQRDGVVFVGGFQHQPNIDAVNYFLDEIWPKVLAIDPSIVFRVIGSHLPDSLRERTGRNVEWVGFVPQLEPLLDQARLTVAPLRFGAGAKGKVVSSLLNGVPCVATPIAAEGMGFADGDGILTAEDADDFARRIASVHDDADRWADLSRRGLEAVGCRYSLNHGIELVEQILPRVTANHERRH